jgi:hypothetical protein
MQSKLAEAIKAAIDLVEFVLSTRDTMVVSHISYAHDIDSKLQCARRQTIFASVSSRAPTLTAFLESIFVTEAAVFYAHIMLVYC